MKIRFNIKYFIKEGIGSIFVHGFLSVAAITVIAACLLITVTVSLLAVNIDSLIKGLEAQNEIMVFIDEKMTRQEALDFGDKLRKVDNISDVKFVSKEELFDNYLKQLGKDAYIMEELRDDNPLRDGYRLTMKDVSLHEQTVKALESMPEIASTKSQKDVSDRLIQIRRVANAVSYTLLGLLGAVSVFIISNTVKLAMFSRKEEIAVMRMVGATNHFIRAPFLVEGIILGMCAGGVAYLMEWGVYSYISKELVASSAVLSLMQFDQFRLPLLGALLAAGLVLGVGGSVLTMQKFLKI